jgi:hypothetical protein
VPDPDSPAVASAQCRRPKAARETYGGQISVNDRSTQKPQLASCARARPALSLEFASASAIDIGLEERVRMEVWIGS